MNRFGDIPIQPDTAAVSVANGQRTRQAQGWLWSAEFSNMNPGIPSHLFGFSFSRSSPATVQTSTSTVLSSGIDANVPRLGFNGTVKGLVFEETRTNLNKDSRNPASSSWTTGTSANITSSATTGPDGLLSASRHQPTSNTFTNYWTNGGVNMAAGSYTFSLWQKQSAAGAASEQQFDFFVNGAATTNDIYGYGGAPPSTWTRYAVTLTHTNAASLIGHNISNGADGRPWNANGGQGIINNARDIYNDLNQVELGKFVTEYIPTNGLTSSRAGERLFRANGNDCVDRDRLSLEFDVTPKGARTDYSSAMRLWSDAGNSGSFVEIGTNGVVTCSLNGTSNTTNAVTWNAFDNVKIFVAMGGSVATTFQMSKNNGSTSTVPVTGSALGSVSVAGASEFLCSGSGKQLTCYVKTIRAYKNGCHPGWVGQ